MKRFVREYASFKKQQAARLDDAEQKRAIEEINKIVWMYEGQLVTEDDAIRELLDVNPLND